MAEGLVFETSEEQADPFALAREVLAPYRQEKPDKIGIKGDLVMLSARQARMFGLVLHELATNAVKYGALAVENGKVQLDWQAAPGEKGGRSLMVIWEERDGPEITTPNRKGFGTRLLHDVVTNELDGAAELRYDPNGLCYRLSFPLETERS